MTGVGRRTPDGKSARHRGDGRFDPFGAVRRRYNLRLTLRNSWFGWALILATRLRPHRAKGAIDCVECAIQGPHQADFIDPALGVAL